MTSSGTGQAVMPLAISRLRDQNPLFEPFDCQGVAARQPVLDRSKLDERVIRVSIVTSSPCLDGT